MLRLGGGILRGRWIRRGRLLATRQKQSKKREESGDFHAMEILFPHPIPRNSFLETRRIGK